MPVVQSPTSASTSQKPDFIEVVDSDTQSLTSSPAPETPTVADESLPVAPTPVAPTPVAPTPVDANASKGIKVEQASDKASNKSQDDEQSNVKVHAVTESAPKIPEKIAKPKSLPKAMKNDQERHDAQAANGNRLTSMLTPLPRTGDRLLDQVLNDLRLSVYHLWLGDTHKIFENCKWVPGRKRNISTLQWKPDAPHKPAGVGGDAILGALGMASLDDTSTNPDSGWLTGWEFNDLHKRKRTFYIVNPGTNSKIPFAYWENQVEGANLIVQNARKLSNGKTGDLSRFVFVDTELGSLRFRAPVFLPLPTAEECGESGNPPVEPESDLPESHRYAGWKFGSDAVRQAFDKVISNGFEPQPLEVYDRSDDLILPNDVTSSLAGAIVLVYFTLERLEFTKNRVTEYQFYANLVKAQIILSTPSPKARVVSRRKLTHGYGPDDSCGREGRPAKHAKTVSISALVN
ncbi:hypothetical protein FRC12_014392 [Ceratobasidium sp. 428]|nr:hypothetical protein FRC12_014392 [Ceratobasidium sp. 428]